MSNVRLQQIADEARIGVSNLTCHFKNKDSIVLAIWQEILQRKNRLLLEYIVLPRFEDIDQLLTSIFEFQRMYLLFFIDTFEVLRIYPEIREPHRQHLEWGIVQFEAIITFKLERTRFLPEKWPGQFKIISK